MTDLPQETFSVIQKMDGYSGRQEGPAITDAAEYLEDGIPHIGMVYQNNKP